jgi:hypothetical protein
MVVCAPSIRMPPWNRRILFACLFGAKRSARDTSGFLHDDLQADPGRPDKCRSIIMERTVLR